MRLFLGFMAFLFISCSHDVERHIASEDEAIILGMVDLKHTTIRYFPPEIKEHQHQHMFYVQAHDWNKLPVDIDPSEVSIRIAGKKVDYQIERVTRGQYTVAFKSVGLKNAILTIQGKRLKLLMDEEKQIPVKELSSVEILVKERNHLLLRVTLKDAQGKRVGLLDLPDFVLGEHVSVRDVRMVKTGVWDVDLSYPDMNLIFYLSVRANGVLLDKIFRFQHVEK